MLYVVGKFYDRGSLRPEDTSRFAKLYIWAHHAQERKELTIISSGERRASEEKDAQRIRRGVGIGFHLSHI